MGGMTASLSLYVILAPFRHLGLNPISSGPGKSSNRTSDFGRNPLYPLRRLPGLEKLSALPPRRGLPDANPGERSSEHNQTEGTKHSHLIGDASGIGLCIQLAAYLSVQTSRSVESGRLEADSCSREIP